MLERGFQEQHFLVRSYSTLRSTLLCVLTPFVMLFHATREDSSETDYLTEELRVYHVSGFIMLGLNQEPTLFRDRPLLAAINNKAVRFLRLVKGLICFELCLSSVNFMQAGI